MTAPVPMPDGTTPSAEAVEAAHRIDVKHRPVSVSVERDSITCACGHETAERLGLAAHRAELTAAAVVAALHLPERDRETAAKAWDEGALRGLQTADWEYGARTNMPDQTNPYRASALREGRADGSL